MYIFRLHRNRRSVADYAGSLLTAQRWNHKGVGMLYCSTSLALAVLEILVHMDKSTIPDNYVWSRAEIGPSAPLDLHSRHLQDEQYTRNLGSAWVQSAQEPSTSVPSVIIPAEWNVLLNPLHAGYEEVPWEPPVPFRFDTRLF